MQKKEFDLRNTEFDPQQMRSLKLIDRDNLYSNIAFLLSDECVHTIKVAVFQGTDQNIFKDRREFHGSLLRQMNEVYDFIDLHNQTHATIEKLLRIDLRDYPEIAIREALLNLLVHRDYSYSASSLISIYTDRIEFVSIGGLMSGIELEDVMLGISVCRNQNLANIFYRLHLIEAYGTGISKIMNAYQGTDSTPILEATKNAFKIILPNINTKKKNVASSSYKGHSVIPSQTTFNEGSDDEEKIVLSYAKEKTAITTKDVSELLAISASTASRLIRRMVKSNQLKQTGKARNTRYTIQNT